MRLYVERAPKRFTSFTQAARYSQFISQTVKQTRALEIFTEKLIPGRWDHVRRPSEQELKGTAALALQDGPTQ